MISRAIFACPGRAGPVFRLDHPCRPSACRVNVCRPNDLSPKCLYIGVGTFSGIYVHRWTNGLQQWSTTFLGVLLGIPPHKNLRKATTEQCIPWRQSGFHTDRPEDERFHAFLQPKIVLSPRYKLASQSLERNYFIRRLVVGGRCGVPRTAWLWAYCYAYWVIHPHSN